MNSYFIENIKTLNITIVSAEKPPKLISSFVHSLTALVMKCKYFIIYRFTSSSYVIYVNAKVGTRSILHFMFLIEKKHQRSCRHNKKNHYDYLNKGKVQNTFLLETIKITNM